MGNYVPDNLWVGNVGLYPKLSEVTNGQPCARHFISVGNASLYQKLSEVTKWATMCQLIHRAQTIFWGVSPSTLKKLTSLWHLGHVHDVGHVLIILLLAKPNRVPWKYVHQILSYLIQDQIFLLCYCPKLTHNLQIPNALYWVYAMFDFQNKSYTFS